MSENNLWENKDSIESFMWKLEETNDVLSDLKNSETQNENQEKIIKENTNKIIYDININNLDDLLKLLLSKDFDFLILEPKDEYIKISFRKDWIEKEAKFVKYPIYSSLLIKIKTLWKLNLEISNLEQKAQIEYKFEDKNLQIISKTVPSNNGEKIFIKANILEKKEENNINQKQKIDPKKALSILASLLIIALIIGSAFLTFVIMNAKTIDDVRFFYELWINLSDINNFLLKLSNIIFPLLVFIESIFLVIFIFKALLTKKEFKKQKTKYTVLSVFFLIVSFSTLSIWMIVDKKIKDLPNWQEEIYGDIQMLDNDKLISWKFDRSDCVITDSSKLIWPENIRYDLSRFVKKQASKWFQITKFYWNFGWEDKQESLAWDLIKTFDKVWLYNVKVIAEWTDIDWKTRQIDVPNMPSINISALVKVEETKMPNWGKTMMFDASDLKNMWELQWYVEDDLSKPAFVWETFRPAKVFFDQSLVWLYIKIEGKTSETLDKVFLVSWDNASEINASIKYEQDLNDPLKYTLSIQDPKSNFWNGFIKQFKWTIDGNIITKDADITNLRESSKITYTFKDYWTNTVKISIIDSSWKIKDLSQTINVNKKLKMINKLKFLVDQEELDYKYTDLSNEYNITSLWTPAKLTIDATDVKTEEAIYILKDASWDTNMDGNPDKTWKSIDMDINTPWVYNIWVEYTFFRINKKDEEIKISERININAEEKEENLSLKITQDSEYVPAKVSFDASNSKVRWQNIVKFAFDYWDWSPVDVRDAINPGHIYTKDWDFIVKMTATTDTWKSYTIEKHVIIKPTQQNAKITLSMKEAPVWQTISFESKDSLWQVTNYSWDFGDWEISSEANPSHAYTKTWTYKVKLTLIFANWNELSDETSVNITE